MKKTMVENASQTNDKMTSHDDTKAQSINMPMQEVILNESNKTDEKSLDDFSPPKLDFTAPPAYDIAMALPSYEEVQEWKLFEEQQFKPIRTTSIQNMPFFNIELDALDEQQIQLGSDMLFFISFFLAFLFNWIGLLILLCFCHTIAGRYGTLAGFGLSLSKYSFIVHSARLLGPDLLWICWIFMVVGLLLCCRFFFHYFYIKKEWKNLNITERLHLYSFF